MNLIALRENLFRRRHRSLCILSGSQTWQAQQLCQLLQSTETFWFIGERLPKTISEIHPNCQLIAGQRLKYHLGQEIDGAMIDIENGINANQLGILSGMIKAGGLLCLLTPQDDWWQLPNPENQKLLNTPLQPVDAYCDFYRHLYNTWQQSNALWISERQGVVNSFIPAGHHTQSTKNGFTLTQDQQQALQKIRHVGFGHRKRPLVISADRGRGKSAILGISAIELLLAGKQHIVLTASRIDQAATAFVQAQNRLQLIQHSSKESAETQKTIEIQKLDCTKGTIQFSYQNQSKCFEFVAPDQLVLQPSTSDLLMVDEAAFLPTPLLTELLKRHHRMVFATTLHGYEGSGRGFELRFKKALHEFTPNWKQIHLNTPIRWAPNDPLEFAINQALLLDIDLENLDNQPDLNTHSIDVDQCEIQALERHRLLQQPLLLKQVFALLVQAHYQTSPNDLQQLLSVPNLKVFVSFYQQQPVAICLVITEGGLAHNLHNLHKPVHGHLVPQLLSRFYACPEILPLKSWRVMRIAVHPQWQKQQLGSGLLQAVITAAQSQQQDFVSSSFGVNPELFRYWKNNGFQAVHLGSKRDKASGQYNLVMSVPLTAPARKTLAAIQAHFEQQFAHLLMESLPYLSTQLVWQLLANFRFTSTLHQYREALQAFAQRQQSYDALSGKLWQASLQLGHAMQQLSAQQQGIWCDKILKKQSWQAVAHHYHLAGKKAVEQQLISIAQKLQTLL